MSASKSNELVGALERLLGKKEGWAKLDDRPAVGGRPGGLGVGLPGSPPSVGSFAPSVGSFEESDASLRTHHAARTITTSDGLISVEYKPIHEVQLVGGGVLVFKDPPPDFPAGGAGA